MERIKIGAAKTKRLGPTKRERHYTLTQNFKVMDLWSPLLYIQHFLYFLVDVEDNHSHLISNKYDELR
jgi:hypothetical protein